MSVSEKLQPESESEFVATAIVSAEVILGMGRHEACTLDIPKDLDIAVEWETYAACGGRISFQNGQTFDHKKIPFRDWLIRKGAAAHYPDAFAGLNLAVFSGRQSS